MIELSRSVGLKPILNVPPAIAGPCLGRGWSRLCGMLVAVWILAGAVPGRADVPGKPVLLSQSVSLYLVAVGSNRPGPGQDTLRYAEDDASRFSEVFGELGGFTENRIVREKSPTAFELRQTLEQAQKDVTEMKRAGKSILFVFYYSGHAKSGSLSLGDEQLPLTELKAALQKIPATVSFTVLDACQSGEYVTSKGAVPSQDFSYNTVDRLGASGIVVMASSSSTELSQESPKLRSSFFTHHLLVGLRGAADRDNNAQVTIDEAYAYAYRNTLLATAKTKIGAQHVRLEVALTGQGEVPLTLLAKYDAKLHLPSGLEGTVLVATPKWVAAEFHKAKADAFTIALPAGTYQIVVRDKTHRWDCLSKLASRTETMVSLGACRRSDLAVSQAKGLTTVGDDPHLNGYRWGLFLGYSFRNFSSSEQGDFAVTPVQKYSQWQFGLTYRALNRLELGLTGSRLGVLEARENLAVDSTGTKITVSEWAVEAGLKLRASLSNFVAVGAHLFSGLGIVHENRSAAPNPSSWYFGASSGLGINLVLRLSDRYAIHLEGTRRWLSGVESNQIGDERQTGLTFGSIVLQAGIW